MRSDTAIRQGTAQPGAIEEELAELLRLVARPGEGGAVQHLQEIAQRVVDGLRRLLGLAGCRLHAVDAFAGFALQRLAASPHAELTAHPTSDAVARALRERRVVSAFDRGLVLAVPLLGGDRPSGVLEVRRVHGFWTSEEMRLVQLFADQAAVALDSARLVTESRQRRRTAEALALMAQATSRSFDVSTLGREIVDTLLLLLGGARATLFEMVGSGFRLVAVARAHGVGADDDVVAAELGPVEARALRDRRLVRTSDFLVDHGPSATGREPGLEAPIRAVLAIPLFHDDGPIGVLSIGDRARRVFEQGEIEVFRAAAYHASVALAHARLHAQAAEAVRVRERVRIANELHDTLGQLAFSVGLKLDWCLHRTAATSAVYPKLEEIRHDTGLMMAQIRQLIGHLSFEALEEETTFPSRLERLVRDFRELTGTSVDLTLQGDPAGLTSAAADVLQKTLQEALVNIAKHARAERTAVLIEVNGDSTSIEVTDDGVGLSVGGTETVGALPGHFGLRQMRERIEGVGGRLEVVGRPGAGVTIRGTVPLGREGT
jgi:signal transduction histidine kinase